MTVLSSDSDKPRTSDLVAASVLGKVSKLKPEIVAEGTQPLNEGFFKLERIRLKPGAKRKARTPVKLRG